MITLGIDIGSTTSKSVLLKDGKQILESYLVKAGTGTNGAEICFNEILLKANLKIEDLECIVATGYGRNHFKQADFQASELMCHALGTHFLLPRTRTVIDIGGQDIKVITLNDKGMLESFQMNDKCAAGTGRFLDVMSQVLQIKIDNFEEEYFKADNPSVISNTCTVFAESEVISQLAQGATISNVAAGVCNSVASRVSSLVKRQGINEEVSISGGVAKNGGVVDSLEKHLNCNVNRSDFAQLAGALGAAILAYRKKN